MAKIKAWTPLSAPPRPIGAAVLTSNPATSNLQNELASLKISYETLRQNAASTCSDFTNLLGEIAETIGDIATELKDLEQSEPQITLAMAHLNDIVDKITTTVWGKGN